MLSDLRKIFFKDIGSNEQASKNSLIHDEIIEVIKGLLNNKIKLVFDVGAHHGSYSKAIDTKIRGAQIHCFEPFDHSFSILKENLIGSNYHLYPLALSNINGKALFYLNRSDETNSLLPSAITNSNIDHLTFNQNIIEVPVRTIDSVCAQALITSIDVLKIDAQGNSLNVLTGALELIKLKKIKIIQCEVEFLEIYKNQSLFHHITIFLEQYNYTLYSLFNVHYDVNNRLSWADAVYYIK